MRGDSLRDLYAKVIAVLGLGVLAGAGALVDYWPNAGVLPRIATTSGDSVTVGPLPVPSDVVRFASNQTDQMRVARAVPVAAPVAVPASFETVAGDDVMDDAALAPPVLNVAGSVALSAHSSATLAAPPPAPVVEPVQSDALIVSFGDLYSAPAIEASRYPMPAPAATDDDGFFVGAVKKTRDSIVRTGRKTGASIFDAFRFVGGAMKKALPG